MYKIDGCFVSSKYHICLIHIYKNASIAIRNSFDMRGKYHKYEDVKNQNLTTITVIREPIRRVISIYQYMLRDEDFGFTNQHSPEKIRKMDFYLQQNNITKSFKIFLDELKNGFFSAVSLPQTTFLSHRNIKIEDFDFILIQENIQDDFKTFTDKYGFGECTLSKDNIGDKKTTEILIKYIKNNSNIQEDIKLIYKDDFELYQQVKYYKQTHSGM